jgi:hypothetical protein
VRYTYLFLDIDKTLIKQFTQIKISNSKRMIELGRHNKMDINNRIKSTVIIPSMGEMKINQKYFDPCRKAVE